MLENLKYYKGSRTTYEAVEGEIQIGRASCRERV